MVAQTSNPNRRDIEGRGLKVSVHPTGLIGDPASQRGRERERKKERERLPFLYEKQI
jgi:hypothetical protein